MVSMNEQVRSVSADISYLAPGSDINRRFVAPGVEVNTGTYEKHRMEVLDGRNIAEQFSLDEHGFVIARHKSAVRDFFDSREVDAVYPDEVIWIVRQLTGADRVATRGWMVRTSGDRGKRQRKVVGYTHSGGVQPPASEAHVDFSPEVADRMARQIFAQQFPAEKTYTRFIASSLWRTFSPPPQDWPLALCDGSTVSIDDGTTNTLIIVDAIPDRATMLGDWPAEKTTIKAAIFRHNPKHRWWYFSNMQRDEVILLKFHDSDRNSVLRVPHTAFRDTSFADASPRESIEFRTFAYFL